RRLDLACGVVEGVQEDLQRPEADGILPRCRRMAVDPAVAETGEPLLQVVTRHGHAVGEDERRGEDAGGGRRLEMREAPVGVDAGESQETGEDEGDRKSRPQQQADRVETPLSHQIPSGPFHLDGMGNWEQAPRVPCRARGDMIARVSGWRRRQCSGQRSWWLRCPWRAGRAPWPTGSKRPAIWCAPWPRSVAWRGTRGRCAPPSARWRRPGRRSRTTTSAI